jgi:hypothetical protein
MIGDTPYDAEAALGAGISAGGLPPEKRWREPFFRCCKEIYKISCRAWKAGSRHLAVAALYLIAAVCLKGSRGTSSKALDWVCLAVGL